MSKQRLSLPILLILQVLAVVIYPLSFFRRVPQSIVLPPALLILLGIALVSMNAGGLSLSAGRSSLIFVQGVNLVVRLMMLMPNAVDAEGAPDWFWIVTQAIAIALSVYSITRLEKRPLKTLLFRPDAVRSE
jgi:hypothetical protein